jgi:hypothetical protein
VTAKQRAYEYANRAIDKINAQKDELQDRLALTSTDEEGRPLLERFQELFERVSQMGRAHRTGIGLRIELGATGIPVTERNSVSSRGAMESRHTGATVTMHTTMIVAGSQSKRCDSMSRLGRQCRCLLD